MASQTFEDIMIDAADAHVDAVLLATSQNAQTLGGETCTLQWKGESSALVSINPEDEPEGDAGFLLQPGNSIYAADIVEIWVKGRGVLVAHADLLA